MPFTFVHPIAIWPFAAWKRKFFPVSGLIAGSMVPDFSYFITLDTGFRFGHSFSGLVILDLPLALAMCWLFHELVRDPLINNLPEPLYARLARYRYQHWTEEVQYRWIALPVSILIGALTHLGWDALTHKNIFMMEIVPWMDQPVEILGRSMSFYNLLHLIFSFFGLVVGFVYLFKLPRERKKQRDFSILPYWASLLVTTAFFSVMLGLIFATQRMFLYPSLFMGPWAIIVTTSFLLALLVCSVLFYQQSVRLRALRSRIRVSRRAGARINS